MSRLVTRLVPKCIASFFLVWLVANARAHSPLETSTRVIARDSTFEITLTVGTEAGARLLEGQPREAFLNRPVGPGFPLSKELTTRLFEVASGGLALSPSKAEVRTDGLEFNFLLTYSRPQTNALSIRANFVEHLPSSLRSAFVITDENGNIFLNRIIQQGDNALESALPSAIPEQQITVATAAVANSNTSSASVATQAVEKEESGEEANFVAFVLPVKTLLLVAVAVLLLFLLILFALRRRKHT